MNAEKIHRMDIRTKCPHCKGTGYAEHTTERRKEKAFSKEDLATLGLFFMVAAFFGTLGFGGNFFLAVFIGLMAFPGVQVLAKWVDRRLGLR